MREIKFRAWDIENKDMMSWDEIEDMWDCEGYFNSLFRGDHWVPMQYTGLKDKNGVEIYEGDIYHHVVTGKRGVIRFDDGGFYCSENGLAEYSLLNINHGCVIGNIYEHPELID